MGSILIEEAVSHIVFFVAEHGIQMNVLHTLEQVALDVGIVLF